VEIARVNMVDNAFFLNSDFLCHHALNAKVEESNKWYQYFGHYNDKALKILHSSNMVEDFPGLIPLARFVKVVNKGRYTSCLFEKVVV